jgi:hypothetical protein
LHLGDYDPVVLPQHDQVGSSKGDELDVGRSFDWLGEHA